MAVAILSPWPPSTSVVARTAAIACIKESIDGGLSDNRANALGEVASALVERYADNAPQAIKNEAVLRCAGWLYEAPSSGIRAQSIGPMSIDFTPSMQSALRHSGAMSLLSPFKIRRAGAI